MCITKIQDIAPCSFTHDGVYALINAFALSLYILHYQVLNQINQFINFYKIVFLVAVSFFLRMYILSLHAGKVFLF